MRMLPEERKTSNWSTQISLSSSTGLSFFTNATTYLARAAGSASQLKQLRRNVETFSVHYRKLEIRLSIYNWLNFNVLI